MSDVEDILVGEVRSLESEVRRLRGQLAVAHTVVGAAWFARGESLPEAIANKTAKLEALYHEECARADRAEALIQKLADAIAKAEAKS